MDEHEFRDLRKTLRRSQEFHMQIFQSQVSQVLYRNLNPIILFIELCSISGASSECVLSDSNRGLSGDTIPTPDWTYYERKVYAVDCHSLHFECPNGKCINQTSVCDGRDDCGDRSDETVCQSELDFQIRLVGSNKTSEGRVEVKGNSLIE